MGRKLKYLFFISCGLSILIGLFISHEHVHFWWEKIGVFDALIWIFWLHRDCVGIKGIRSSRDPEG